MSENFKEIYNDGEAVTPNDSTIVDYICISIDNDTDVVKVQMAKRDKTGGNDINLKGKGYHKVRVRKVYNTGTSIAGNVNGFTS